MVDWAVCDGRSPILHEMEDIKHSRERALESLDRYTSAEHRYHGHGIDIMAIAYCATSPAAEEGPSFGLHTWLHLSIAVVLEYYQGGRDRIYRSARP